MGRKELRRASSHWNMADRPAKAPLPDLRALLHSTFFRLTSSFSRARSVGSGGLSPACAAWAASAGRASGGVSFDAKVEFFP
ncbi:hypothetical protein D9M72_570210 [compost metagenome]